MLQCVTIFNIQMFTWPSPIFLLELKKELKTLKLSKNISSNCPHWGEIHSKAAMSLPSLIYCNLCVPELIKFVTRFQHIQKPNVGGKSLKWNKKILINHHHEHFLRHPRLGSCCQILGYSLLLDVSPNRIKPCSPKNLSKHTHGPNYVYAESGIINSTIEGCFQQTQLRADCLQIIHPFTPVTTHAPCKHLI